MRTMKNVFLIILILLFTFAFGSCKQSKTVKKASSRPTTEAKTVQPQSKPEEEDIDIEELFSSEGYDYDPGMRRDPFIPLVVVKKKVTAKKIKKIPANAPPLESFAATEFKVIATASGKDGFYAMLLAPDKKAYTVKKGTKLGYNGGKIVEINMNEVIVVELIENELKKIEPRKIILSLRKGE